MVEPKQTKVILRNILIARAILHIVFLWELLQENKKTINVTEHSVSLSSIVSLIHWPFSTVWWIANTIHRLSTFLSNPTLSWNTIICVVLYNCSCIAFYNVLLYLAPWQNLLIKSQDTLYQIIAYIDLNGFFSNSKHVQHVAPDYYIRLYRKMYFVMRMIMRKLGILLKPSLEKRDLCAGRLVMVQTRMCSHTVMSEHQFFVWSVLVLL